MSSVDNRIVKMVFDNASFKRGAADTQQSLANLDKAVSAAGNNKGLLNLDGHMQRVTASASKMTVATTAAIATIASKATSTALNFGKNMLGSITSTIFQAGKARAEALEQAKFQFKGLGLDINKTMASALAAVKGTAFGLQDAATVAAQFGGAGIKAGKEMTAALTGISGIAAQTGKSYSEIGQIFTGIAGVGKLTSQDLIQFGTRGLNVAAALGKQMHLTEAQVRDMVSKGKISFKDFAAFANTAFGKNAKKSNETYAGSLANVKAALTRIGADIAAPRLEALKNIFNTLTPAVDAVHEALLPALNDLGKFELKTADKLSDFIKSLDVTKVVGPIMRGFGNIFAPFVALFKAVGDAWKQVFPGNGKTAADRVYSVANAFETLTKPLAWVAKQIPHLVPLFAALFGLFKTGVHGITAVGNAIQSLFKSFSGPNIPTKGISNFLSSFIDQFHKLVGIGATAAHDFLNGFSNAFTNGSGDTVANILGAGFLGLITVMLRKLLKGSLSIDLTGGTLKSITASFHALTGSLRAMQVQLQAKALKEIAIAIGLLTASVIALSFVNPDRLTKSLTAMSAGFAELLVSMGILVKISGSAGFVKVPLIAASMVALATSILILTAAIALMSMLSWDQIGKGLTGVAGALVVISAGMALMPKTLPLTGAGLVLVGLGLTEIAGALALMSVLSWSDIGKGLTTTAGAIVAIAAGMQLMPISLPITAAGLVLVGIALTGIAAALKIMGSMSWTEIGKGLTTLGGALLLLALGMNAMNGTLLGSAALLVAATAIDAITPALVIFSKLSWEGIAKAMVGLAGSLLILAGGLTLMTGAIPGALALLIISPALLALSTALLALSTLSWEELGRSLAALAGGLVVIGLAGLLIGPVVPALLGLGAALLLLGAGLALAGAGILAFSTALGILVSLGAGAISYLSKYISAFVALMPEIGKGFGLLIASFAGTIAQHGPELVDAFVTVLSSMIKAAQKVLPKLGPLITTALRVGLGILVKFIPDFTNAGADIVIGVLRGLTSRIPKIVKAAADLAIAFINAIGDEAPRIIDAGVKMIIKLINGLTKAIKDNDDQFIKACENLGKALMTGMAKGIAAMAFAPIKAIGKVASDVVGKAKGLLHINSPSKVFMAIGSGIVEGLTKGIQDNAVSAINAVATMVKGQIGIANEYLSKFIQDLDQTAISARGKATGLARAAEEAQNAAQKTKSTKDDAKANALSKSATAADKAATKAEEAAQKAKDAQDRANEFAKADSLGRAQMKSEDAQSELDLAKAAEQRIAAGSAQAAALEKQAKASGTTKAQRKAWLKQAADLRAQMINDERSVQGHLDLAKKNAADALAYQTKAGQEAADAFQKAFNDEAQADADSAIFNKLSDAEKAVQRKKQADELQRNANADLEAAKKLAFTDLDGANKLAEQARSEAEQARNYLTEAANYTNSASGSSGSVSSGSVVNLKPTDAAAAAMNDYSNLYKSATAAAAATKNVEFNQYNTSPEALSPTEIYRQSNNLFAYAVEKIDDAA